jgi:chemotaxis family two-component system sensor kinase Cph1
MADPGVSANETLVTAKNVDFSNCDRELVQFPGAIQPHGAMLVLEEPGYVVTQASVNCRELVGKPPGEVVGRSISELFGENAAKLLDQLHRMPLDHAPVHVVREFFAGSTNDVNIFAHRADDSLILELEAVSREPSLSHSTLYSHVRATMARLQATRGLQAFLNLAVEQIRGFTGYDRVMAYKFDEDGSGHVIAEAKRDDLEPYLGLHYPATDIPAPARRMFSLSWLRHLPNVDYVPVPVVPENSPATGRPVDMSYAILRSVSVMYSDYLKNMGVKSTMVMPLMKEGTLWGLISAMHHSAPRHVPYEARMAAEVLAHMLSLLTAAKEDADGADNRQRMKAVGDELVEALCRESDLNKSLGSRDRGPNLLSMIPAQGAAVVWRGNVSLMGVTPSQSEVEALVTWLLKANQAVFATDRLPELYEPAGKFKSQASGVLSARLSSHHADFLLWFRPEHIEIVNWAGDPKKPMKVSETDGEIRLSPRTSFALWKESVTGRSQAWHKDEKEAAAQLRQAIMEVILTRAEEIERTNRALAEANIELDSFAYVASHDLKEPLRGIHHMATFLKRGLDGELDAQGRQQLETILKLTRRMDDLLESLLQYSRTGRAELTIGQTDLDALVDESLVSCKVLISEAETEIRRPASLGVAPCDRVRIGEVLTNLIANAIKYNDKPERWVEIGVEQGEPKRYYVRDNGIGIEADARERIFEIFRRIHGSEEFGGGVGAGLTIARKIVERHGGQMWVDSELGQGSTFYFTLGPEGAQ